MRSALPASTTATSLACGAKTRTTHWSPDTVRPEKSEWVAVGGCQEGVEFGAVEGKMAQFHGRGVGGSAFRRAGCNGIRANGAGLDLSGRRRAGMACELLFFPGMQALRLVILLAAVPVCYLLFFHSQPTGDTSAAPEVQSQYKRDMDQARDAARQMQAQKAEADAIQ